MKTSFNVEIERVRDRGDVLKVRSGGKGGGDRV